MARHNLCQAILFSVACVISRSPNYYFVEASDWGNACYCFF